MSDTQEKRTLLEPWYLYKLKLNLTDEAPETFHWISIKELSEVYSYIRTILDNHPELRNKIRTYSGDNILCLKGSYFTAKYTDVVLYRALYSYRSLLNNWTLWTKTIKENIAYHAYLNKQLTSFQLMTQYGILKNPDMTVRYIAEEYNMDVPTYTKTLTRLYDDFIRSQQSEPKDYLYSGPPLSIKPVLPGFVRLVWRNR